MTEEKKPYEFGAGTLIATDRETGEVLWQSGKGDQGLPVITEAAEHRSGFIFEPLSKEYLPVKPCPFCGMEDIGIFPRKLFSEVVLECLNCGARGANWHYREERAIPDWNNRG